MRLALHEKVEQDMIESSKMMKERGAKLLALALARGDELKPCPMKCANGKRRVARRWVACRSCTGTGLVTRRSS